MTEENLKEKNSKEEIISTTKSYVPDIKWNAIDAVIALVFLAVVLVAVYFGSAKLIEVFGGEEFFNSSNISNISFNILYGIQVLLMLGVVWFFAILRRKSGI